MSNPEDEARETVELARRIRAWLVEIDAHTTGAGVDFADAIAAAKEIEALVLRLLSLRTSDVAQAREARSILGELYAWLFGELRPHLNHLEQVWEKLEDALAVRAPEPDD